MAYSLCLALGVKHPDELLRTLTSRQWAGWCEYARWDPWGGWRADLRAAIIAAAARPGADPRRLMLKFPIRRRRRRQKEAEQKRQWARLEKLWDSD